MTLDPAILDPDSLCARMCKIVHQQLERRAWRWARESERHTSTKAKQRRDSQSATASMYNSEREKKSERARENRAVGTLRTQNVYSRLKIVADDKK